MFLGKKFKFNSFIIFLKPVFFQEIKKVTSIQMINELEKLYQIKTNNQSAFAFNRIDKEKYV